MGTHPNAGKRAETRNLVNVPRLVAAYFIEHPDPSDPSQRVAFGTSGHRCSSLSRSFNEAHILAMTQAICERRGHAGATGPLFLGMDTHALSEPAFRSALEVLAGNGVTVMVDRDFQAKTNLLVQEKVGKIGENIQVRRFARFKLGEGIEKKRTDLAAEVAAVISGGA